MEKFWIWLVKFDARRFMLTAVIAGLATCGLGILLMILGFRLNTDQDLLDPRQGMYLPSDLPEVPQLPDMAYTHEPSKLYHAPSVDQWVKQQQEKAIAAKKQQASKQAAPKQVDQPSPPKKPVAPPVKTVKVRLSGVMQNTSGTLLALVENLERKNTTVLQEGGQLHGWTVQAINRSSVILTHPDAEDRSLLPGSIVQLKGPAK